MRDWEPTCTDEEESSVGTKDSCVRKLERWKQGDHECPHLHALPVPALYTHQPEIPFPLGAVTTYPSTYSCPLHPKSWPLQYSSPLFPTLS